MAKNMNPQFLGRCFRNFDFLIHNSHDSDVLYPKTWKSKLPFLKQIKKIGIQNS